MTKCLCQCSSSCCSWDSWSMMKSSLLIYSVSNRQSHNPANLHSRLAAHLVYVPHHTCIAPNSGWITPRGWSLAYDSCAHCHCQRDPAEAQTFKLVTIPAEGALRARTPPSGMASIRSGLSIRERAATAAEAGLSGWETPPPRILSPQAMLPQARTQPQARVQPQPMLLPSDRAMAERYKVSPGLFDRGPPTDPMPTRQQMPPGTRSPVMLDSPNARASQDKVRRAEQPTSCLCPVHPTSHHPHQHSHHTRTSTRTTRTSTRTTRIRTRTSRISTCALFTARLRACCAL